LTGAGYYSNADFGSHPTGAAPVIEDNGIVLAESGAIAEYILNKYGNGKLVVTPNEPTYADYLYWLHFANGYFQPALTHYMLAQRLGQDPDTSDNPSMFFIKRGRTASLQMLEDRLTSITSKWRTQASGAPHPIFHNDDSFYSCPTRRSA
jgi:glutathione S-transferase